MRRGTMRHGRPCDGRAAMPGACGAAGSLPFDGLDTATRTAKDADFSTGRESRAPRMIDLSSPVDPLDELKRILPKR